MRFHQGSTVLHWAVESGEEAWVNLCLDAGADVTIRDAENLSALDVALDTEYADMIELMSNAVRWHRRRVGIWLSSGLSGGDNILYHLPTDVAHMCILYL